ncbi:MAG: hypothetical protein R2911_42990 [Caldilineaceae bacterium]
MMIDIHKLDKFDDAQYDDEGWEEPEEESEWPDEEEVLEGYSEALIEQFAESPEGKALIESAGDIGFWIEVSLRYGYLYEGFSPPSMDAEDMSVVVEEILPRKVSLGSPEDADRALPELIAFWRYLERAYELKNALPIIRYLQSISPDEFRKDMFDPRRAGMAKSFFLEGREAGFDMSNPEEMNRYLSMQRAAGLAQIRADMDSQTGFGPFIEESGKSTQRTAKEKSRRKMAKASRKQNRKPKKKKKRK